MVNTPTWKVQQTYLLDRISFLFFWDFLLIIFYSLL